MKASDLKIGDSFTTTIPIFRSRELKVLAVKGNLIAYAKFGVDFIWMDIEYIKPYRKNNS
jgi:hypothetical protein